MQRREFLTAAVGAAGVLLLPLPAVVSAVPRAYRDANMHRDFAPCYSCGAETWKQHAPDCPRGAIPAGEEKFYESLQPRLIEIRKRGHAINRLTVDQERDGFHFVRVWVQGEESPYTWYHPA